MSDDDRLHFLNCLRTAHEKFGAVVDAYCLMQNHYHLLAETPRGDLSKIMHLINTAYSIHFNKKNARCGHPFLGRFSAVLVQAEMYARELAAYVHLNPVRARIVESPEEYPWSNYREYLCLVPSQSWTRTSFVLGLFASDPSRARRLYEEYVQRHVGRFSPNPLQAAESIGILGQADFITRIQNTVPIRESDPIPREVPQLRKLRFKPSFPALVAEAERIFGPRNSFARNAAIYVSHKKTGYSLKEIASYFDLSISGVSDASRSIRREMKGNVTISRAIEEIASSMFH